MFATSRVCQSSVRAAAGALAFLFVCSASAQAEARLLRVPAIRGETLVFVYAGDLWVGRVGGTETRRLTSHPGGESRPKISPDGKWVTFVGEYDGAGELYIVPLEGGEPKRLTYQGGVSRNYGWTPDGKVAFGSNAGNFTRTQNRLWYVRPQGGLPIRTAVAEVSEASFMPDGQSIVYTRGVPAPWRRYRGGQQGKIAFFNLNTNAYSELPTERENSYYPMVVGRSVYYISDRKLATYNLYRYDLDRKTHTQLTNFSDADILFPDTDGKSIVFERDGRLHVFDIATGKVATQTPRINSDLLHARPSVRSLTDYISWASVAPGGSRVAIEARGEIFSLPTKDGQTVNLTNTPGVRERRPRWSPDGNTLAYISDASGNYEIYSQPRNGGTPTRLTNLNGATTFINLKWAPNGKMLELRTIANDIYLLDVETKRMTKAFRLTSAGVQSDWSPDGRWIAFVNLGANQLGALSLYEVATAKVTKVTSGYYGDSTAAFDQNGRYLYLRSTRSFTPGSGRFEFSMKIENAERLYIIPLTRSTPNPLRRPLDDDAMSLAYKPQPAETNVRIDLEGFEDRMLPLPLPTGAYFGIYGAKDGVIYVSATPGTPGVSLSKFDLESGQSQTFYTGPSVTADFTPDRTKMVTVSGANIRVMDVKPGGSNNAIAVETSDVRALVDPRQEWRQMFWDAWRFQRDTFYDVNMRGLDWMAIGKRYEAYLPHVAHRSDLNQVIRWMINELGTSHAYIEGGDLGLTGSPVAMGQLGADYEVEGDHIRFAKVYHGDSFDEARRGPLGEHGHRVENGEYLLAIEGEPVKSSVHPNSLLVGKAGRWVTITVNSRPTMEGARKLRVRPVASEINLRQDTWAEETRRYVERASGGRIGYMHVPNVMVDGAAAFIRGFYGQLDKEALIVDERWNSGGMFIQQLIVEILGRKPLLGVQQRNSPDFFSIRAIEGPKAMLVNEHAGSGGDSFPFTFRAGGVGPLIGRRTMGALVGLNEGWTFIDGGSVTSPETGIYDLKTGMLVAENVGMQPDIEVDMRPDLVAQGKDPQLEAAIKYLLDELRKSPKRKPRTDLPQVQPQGRIGNGK